MSDETIMPFDFPQDNPTIIKVIGVGGGGGNAVITCIKKVFTM